MEILLSKVNKVKNTKDTNHGILETDDFYGNNELVLNDVIPTKQHQLFVSCLNMLHQNIQIGKGISTSTLIKI